MLFCLMVGYAQVKPDQGEQNLPKDSTQTQGLLEDTSTSSGIFADPNEIIGPMGYDSIYWVFVKDSVL